MMRPCWSYSASTLVSPSRSRRLAACSQACAEPDGFGQPGVAERVGEQGHAAAVLHRLQLADVPGQDDLGAAWPWRRRSGRPGPGRTASRPRRSPAGCPGRSGPGRGRRAGRAGGPGTGRRCTTPGPRRPGCCGPTGTAVMPITGPSPAAAQIRRGLGQHPGLPGPGRRVDHRHAAGRRSGRPARRRPGPRAARCACACLRVAARPRASWRASGQRVLEPRGVRAERVRGLRAGHARRAVRARRARPCALPWPAARAWRTGCRRAAGRRCARPRAASCAGTSAGSGASRQVTGSNSERSARSARSSSSAAAAAGSRPVRGRTRPRYLIRSARVQVLFSCWASATAFCAARASSSSAGPRLPRRARARPRGRLRRATPTARPTPG